MPLTVSNVKAADPGVAFTLEVPANEQPLGTSLRAVVTITDPDSQIQYTSEVWARNPINNRVMVCMAPFGDGMYTPGKILQFNIDLYFPCDAEKYSVQQKGEVIATSGRFDLGSEMIVRVNDHGGLQVGPSTNGMPMMESEDGNFIGIIHPDGCFSIYPQFVFGEGEKMEPTYLSNTNAEHKINGHPVTIYLSEGRIYFYANFQNLFVSEEQFVGAYMVIQRNGFYLVRPGSPIMPPVMIGPLTFTGV